MDVRALAAAARRRRTSGPTSNRMGSRDQVKFVIKDRRRLRYARDAVARHALGSPVRRSPVLSGPRCRFNRKELSSGILEDRLTVALYFSADS